MARSFFVVWAGAWPSSAGGPVRTVAGSTLRRGPPPLSGAGIQAFSMRKPGRKESQGGTPCTSSNKTARWGSLHLLGWCPLRPSLSGSYAPDQIWKRIFGEYVLAGYCSVKNPAIENPKKESPQIRARRWVTIKPSTVPLRLYPKRWSERAASGLENPGAGRSPAILSPCFLIKKAGPPPGRRAPRGAAPRCG